MILDRIVAHKKTEVAGCKKLVSPETLRSRCENLDNRDKSGHESFAEALRKNGEVALIAEIKKASPSKGLIREDFDPAETAGIYTAAGASAISVLTDREFFRGSPEYLKIVKGLTEIPVLRKDFIVDPYQIYEARLLGADAILLIMAILADQEAAEFLELAFRLGMQCLVEVHTEDELARALALNARVIGINNRDLKTFKTDLATTFRLRELITDPEITVVSESGINTRQDVMRLREHGVHAMLVGEALMRERDIGHKVRELLGTAGTAQETA